MPLTDNQKNQMITILENSLDGAQAGAGVTASLDEIETAVAALRTAYDTDPDTVLAADLVAALDMEDGCVFSNLTSNTALINAVRSEAG